MKPILILWVPAKANLSVRGGKRLSVSETMDLFIKYADNQLKSEASVLVIPKMEAEDFSVEVFNAENINPLEIDKLREEINNYAKSLSNG